MKIYTKFFIVIALAVVFISCGSKTTTTTTTTDNKTTTTTSSTGKKDTTNSEFSVTETFYKSVTGCKKTDSNCSYIEIMVTKLMQGPAKDKINKAVLDSVMKFSYTGDSLTSFNMNAVLDTFVAGFNANKADMTSRGYGADVIPWALETNASIPYSNPVIVSYQIYSYSFLGGAHPSTNNWYYNFDWNTGNVLKITDILKPGFEKKLNELIVADFRKQKNMKPNEPLNSILFNNTLTYTNNFAIQQGKLVFVYNPYDIAAYVYGPTVIEIPVGEIIDYVVNPAMFQYQ
jgi:hypothetical protein